MPKDDQEAGQPSSKRAASDGDFIFEKRAGYSPSASLVPENLPDDIFQAPPEPPAAEQTGGSSNPSDDS